MTEMSVKDQDVKQETLAQVYRRLLHDPVPAPCQHRDADGIKRCYFPAEVKADFCHEHHQGD